MFETSFLQKQHMYYCLRNYLSLIQIARTTLKFDLKNFTEIQRGKLTYFNKKNEDSLCQDFFLWKSVPTNVTLYFNFSQSEKSL